MAHLTAQQALSRLMNGGRRRVKGSAPCPEFIRAIGEEDISIFHW